jgi:hypothetical protein
MLEDNVRNARTLPEATTRRAAVDFKALKAGEAVS